ncbi:MAG: DpnII family type II restriction endonuclease [Actinobacteria bacterium]|nr:DpnII family type II restriction endonuclease [Actinomycetota bacterium]
MNKAGKRSFGYIRKLPSGRFQASYVGPDGKRYFGPGSYRARKDANEWISKRQVEIQSETWIVPKSLKASEKIESVASSSETLASPSLIVRDGANSSRFAVIEDLVRLGEKATEFDFSIPASTQEQRDAALDFIKKSGLQRLFKKDGVKNLVDYVLGVEAGLDSNGRKNRSGTSMETVVEAYLSEFTSSHQLEYISQATAMIVIRPTTARFLSDSLERMDNLTSEFLGVENNNPASKDTPVAAHLEEAVSE